MDYKMLNNLYIKEFFLLVPIILIHNRQDNFS